MNYICLHNGVVSNQSWDRGQDDWHYGIMDLDGTLREHLSPTPYHGSIAVLHVQNDDPSELSKYSSIMRGMDYIQESSIDLQSVAALVASSNDRVRESIIEKLPLYTSERHIVNHDEGISSAILTVTNALWAQATYITENPQEGEGNLASAELLGMLLTAAATENLTKRSMTDIDILSSKLCEAVDLLLTSEGSFAMIGFDDLTTDAPMYCFASQVDEPKSSLTITSNSSQSFTKFFH